MPGYDDEDDFESAQERPQKTGLRAHVDRLEAEIKELRTRNTELESGNRQRVVGDVLAKFQVDKAIAEFIPADIEPTEAAVIGWLEPRASIFGLVPNTAATPSPVDDEMAANLRRMSSTEQGATSSINTNQLAAIESAESMEDLAAAWGGRPL